MFCLIPQTILAAKNSSRNLCTFLLIIASLQYDLFRCYHGFLPLHSCNVHYLRTETTKHTPVCRTSGVQRGVNARFCSMAKCSTRNKTCETSYSQPSASRTQRHSTRSTLYALTKPTRRKGTTKLPTWDRSASRFVIWLGTKDPTSRFRKLPVHCAATLPKAMHRHTKHVRTTWEKFRVADIVKLRDGCVQSATVVYWTRRGSLKKSSLLVRSASAQPNPNSTAGSSALCIYWPC